MVSESSPFVSNTLTRSYIKADEFRNQVCSKRGGHSRRMPPKERSHRHISIDASIGICTLFAVQGVRLETRPSECVVYECSTVCKSMNKRLAGSYLRTTSLSCSPLPALGIPKGNRRKQTSFKFWVTRTTMSSCHSTGYKG